MTRNAARAGTSTPRRNAPPVKWYSHRQTVNFRMFKITLLFSFVFLTKKPIFLCVLPHKKLQKFLCVCEYFITQKDAGVPCKKLLPLVANILKTRRTDRCPMSANCILLVVSLFLGLFAGSLLQPVLSENTLVCAQEAVQGASRFV